MTRQEAAATLRRHMRKTPSRFVDQARDKLADELRINRERFRAYIAGAYWATRLVYAQKERGGA